jgi:hypothetical protein
LGCRAKLDYEDTGFTHFAIHSDVDGEAEGLPDAELGAECVGEVACRGGAVHAHVLRAAVHERHRHLQSHPLLRVLQDTPGTKEGLSRRDCHGGIVTEGLSRRDCHTRDCHGGIVTRGIATRGIVTRGIATRGIATRGIVTRGIVTRGIRLSIEVLHEGS